MGIEAERSRLAKLDQDEKVPFESNNTDKSCSLLGIFYATGSMVGPVLGGALNDAHGFRLTCEIVAGLQLGFSILYFSVIILPDLLQRKKATIKDIEIPLL